MSDIENREYKLPKHLSRFQHELYTHLIDWKRQHISPEPGIYNGREYDAVLPAYAAKQYYPLYRPIVDEITKHHEFKPHRLFGHMASSQVACMNLFTPILQNHLIADRILPQFLPDYKSLAVDELESGYQFEYWDRTNPLNDHAGGVGTDVDLAVAYYDYNDDLCFWFIEHKLAEREFTTCGGYRSKRNLHKEQCRNTSLILDNPDNCFYTYGCNYLYWKLTLESGLFSMDQLCKSETCPFLGGVNQLWRNLILAEAMKSKGRIKHYHFSVVHHPENPHLENTIRKFQRLLADQSVFSILTSEQIISAASQINNPEINEWIKWYRDLYNINKDK